MYRTRDRPSSGDRLAPASRPTRWCDTARLVGGARTIAWAFAICVSACSARPSDAELDRMLEEVRAADEEAAREHGRDDERSGWSLTIGGDVAHPVTLSWAELEAIHPTELRT